MNILLISVEPPRWTFWRMFHFYDVNAPCQQHIIGINKTYFFTPIRALIVKIDIFFILFSTKLYKHKRILLQNRRWSTIQSVCFYYLYFFVVYFLFFRKAKQICQKHPKNSLHPMLRSDGKVNLMLLFIIQCIWNEIIICFCFRSGFLLALLLEPS